MLDTDFTAYQNETLEFR